MRYARDSCATDVSFQLKCVIDYMLCLVPVINRILSDRYSPTEVALTVEPLKLVAAPMENDAATVTPRLRVNWSLALASHLLSLIPQPNAHELMTASL